MNSFSILWPFPFAIQRYFYIFRVSHGFSINFIKSTSYGAKKKMKIISKESKKFSIMLIKCSFSSETVRLFVRYDAMHIYLIHIRSIFVFFFWWHDEGQRICSSWFFVVSFFGREARVEFMCVMALPFVPCIAKRKWNRWKSWNMLHKQDWAIIMALLSTLKWYQMGNLLFRCIHKGGLSKLHQAHMVWLFNLIPLFLLPMIHFQAWSLFIVIHFAVATTKGLLQKQSLWVALEMM